MSPDRDETVDISVTHLKQMKQKWLEIQEVPLLMQN
jgi:hypothetical protein